MHFLLVLFAQSIADLFATSSVNKIRLEDVHPGIFYIFDDWLNAEYAHQKDSLFSPSASPAST
jgi:hypothetical protein